ncbi:MAG TPA: CcdC protein domain-containing protein [Sphingomonas sp.]|nr:CcdC protein domain-containing protein [Sphingomonas sp.]
MNASAPQQGWISYAIPAVVILVVLALRWRRLGRARPLKVERLWIVPAIYLLVAALGFWRFPPVGLGWLWCLLALAAGAGLGWQRGRLMRISVDPVTHQVSQSASPATMIFILALILIRSGMRNAEALGGPAFHVDVAVLTDVLIAFALGLLTATRVEMWLRARRLLARARGEAVISEA